MCRLTHTARPNNMHSLCHPRLSISHNSNECLVFFFFTTNNNPHHGTTAIEHGMYYSSKNTHTPNPTTVYTFPSNITTQKYYILNAWFRRDVGVCTIALYYTERDKAVWRQRRQRYATLTISHCLSAWWRTQRF